MKTFQALLVLTLGAVLLTSCGGGDGVERRIYAEPPTVERYLESLSVAHLALVDQMSLLLLESSAPSQEQYQAIVQKYKEEGLEALSTSERQSLLLVAQAAFLENVFTVRYSLTAQDSSGQPADGRVEGVLEEAKVTRQGGSVIVARQVSGTGIQWPPGLFPRLNSRAPSEIRVFYDPWTWPMEPSDYVRGDAWSIRAGEWACERFQIDRFTWLVTYGSYLEYFFALALGDLLQQETIDDRGVYRFEFEGRDVFDRDFSYWIDAKTLWLRQHEFEEDGIHYLVKLEAINEDIRIEPPDVDVECVEEEPG